jgi:cyanophycinase
MAGYLMLNGGGEFGKGQEQADLFALQQAGGKEAAICLLAAGADGDSPASKGADWFRALGAVNVAALTLENRAGADRPDFAGKVAGSRLIYLAGDNPAFLLETLQGSLVWEAIRQAFAQGAMLAGANAGGMVLMEHLYDPARGAIRPGLGLFPNTLFMPQFNGEGRKWLPLIQKALPHALLIGVAEKVAIAGRGNDWQVYGRGWITIYRQGKPYKYQGGQPFKMQPLPF